MIRSSRVWQRRGAAAVMMASVAASALAAHAEVRREGRWPATDPVVTLDVDGIPRNDALTRLAKAAGWSLVVTAPKGDLVSLHVTGQPAGKVLDILLADGRYVARRDDTLVSITPAPDGPRAGTDDPAPATPPTPPTPPVPPTPPTPPTPALPPVPPVPPVPPAPPSAAADADDDADEGDARDRTVTGGALRIEKGEVVNDVTVLGGTLDVWGTITGDLAVFGGAARIHGGGRVQGDASMMGGTLDLEDGASIDGDVNSVGGALHRADGARIGGDVNDGIRHRRHERHRDHARHPHGHGAGDTRPGATPAAKPDVTPDPRPARDVSAAGTVTHAADKIKIAAERPHTLRDAARDLADAVNGAALLFVFGAVLLALAPARMDQLKLQVASRPMRTFATGVVAVLAGLVLLAAVCVTIVGIPLALVALVAAVFATFAGICSVLETVGGALLAHRTKNPYVHLACGGLVFLVAGAIPFLGAFVKLAVILTAIGSIAATRAAGLVPAKLRGPSPYRDAPV